MAIDNLLLHMTFDPKTLRMHEIKANTRQSYSADCEADGHNHLLNPCCTCVRGN